MTEDIKNTRIELTQDEKSDVLSWAVKYAVGDFTTAEERRRAKATNPQVLNNLLNKILASKTENKNEHTVFGIEEILKKAKEQRADD